MRARTKVSGKPSSSRANSLAARLASSAIGSPSPQGKPGCQRLQHAATCTRSRGTRRPDRRPRPEAIHLNRFSRVQTCRTSPPSPASMTVVIQARMACLGRATRSTTSCYCRLSSLASPRLGCFGRACGPGCAPCGGRCSTSSRTRTMLRRIMRRCMSTWTSSSCACCESSSNLPASRHPRTRCSYVEHRIQRIDQACLG